MVPLVGLAEITPDAEVQEEVIDRVDEVSEPCLHRSPGLVGVGSPAATEGGLHAYEEVVDAVGRLGVGEIDVTIGFRQGLHPGLKIPVCDAKANVQGPVSLPGQYSKVATMGA